MAFAQRQPVCVYPVERPHLHPNRGGILKWSESKLVPITSARWQADRHLRHRSPEFDRALCCLSALLPQFRLIHLPFMQIM